MEICVDNIDTQNEKELNKFMDWFELNYRFVNNSSQGEYVWEILSNYRK